MYEIPIKPSETKSIKYKLNTLFETQDKFEMSLLLFLQFTDAGNNLYQTVAYDNTITIDEPELSILDPQV